MVTVSNEFKCQMMLMFSQEYAGVHNFIQMQAGYDYDCVLI